jgi:hypothetical protein
MAIAWMIFGENGHYQASKNMPAQLVSTILKGLNVSGRTQAVIAALQKGLAQSLSRAARSF